MHALHRRHNRSQSHASASSRCTTASCHRFADPTSKSRPHRNPMPPPNCRPIGQSRFSPSQSRYPFRISLRHDLHACRLVTASIADLCELVHLHEPLVRQDTARSASCCDRNGQGRSRGLRLPPSRPAASISATTASRAFFIVRPRYFAGALSLSVPSGLRMLINPICLISLPHCVVVRIVGRRDLHRTRAEFRLRPFVGNERNLAASERQLQHHAALGHVTQRISCGCTAARRSAERVICSSSSPFSFAVAASKLFAQFRADLVERGRRIRMHRHRRIAEHRFRPRRGDRHVRRLARLRIDHRILEVPEVPLRRFVKNLIIAHGRLQKRVPIHQPLAAIDFAVLETAGRTTRARPGHIGHRA